MEKLSIDNLEKLIRAGAAIGSAAGEVYEDGKITFADLDELWSLRGSMQDLMLVDFDQAVPEFKELDNEERDHLIAVFDEEFDIPQEHLEAAVEGYLARGIKLYLAIQDLIEFHQEVWATDEEDEEEEA